MLDPIDFLALYRRSQDAVATETGGGNGQQNNA
jgi:hypothetical protein